MTLLRIRQLLAEFKREHVDKFWPAPQGRDIKLTTQTRGPDCLRVERFVISLNDDSIKNVHYHLRLFGKLKIGICWIPSIKQSR